MEVVGGLNCKNRRLLPLYRESPHQQLTCAGISEIGLSLQTCKRSQSGLARPGGAARTSFVRGGLPYWQCGACSHQCSLISGTMFESSKLPLRRWFLAMQLLTSPRITSRRWSSCARSGSATVALGCSSTRSWKRCACASNTASSTAGWRSTTPTSAVSIQVARAGAARKNPHRGRGPDYCRCQADRGLLASTAAQRRGNGGVRRPAHRDLRHRGLGRPVVFPGHCHRRRRAPTVHRRWRKGSREVAAVQGHQTRCSATSRPPSAAPATLSTSLCTPTAISPSSNTDSIEGSTCVPCSPDCSSLLSPLPSRASTAAC